MFTASRGMDDYNNTQNGKITINTKFLGLSSASQLIRNPCYHAGAMDVRAGGGRGYWEEEAVKPRSP
jgi:hypothetical protein